MKIKRYVAASMRAALDKVRAEQGPDAVILSSRRVDEGIEVIAAVDYDEALFVDATRRRAPSMSLEAPAPAAAAKPAHAAAPACAAAPAQQAARPPRMEAPTQAGPPIQAPAPPPAATPARKSDLAAARAAPVPALKDAAVGGFAIMQRELKDLRKLLESELSSMSWNDKRLREPLQARVLEELWAVDIAPDVAMQLAALAPQCADMENPANIPLALLVRHLPVVNKLSTVNGGVIAVVGPTGAGKTTTIAKLAARWCMQHGSEDLALVSTDAYRIGARDQLRTYARILDTPLHAANSGKELAQVLARLKSKRLILIDTAGIGPRDLRLTEQLDALQLGAARARVLLALPAQGEGHALDSMVRAFARVSPAACILTKVDEAVSLGAVISTTLRHKLKIAYLCDGQRVPEDLHAAHQRRLWLTCAALELKEHAPPRGDSGYYARNFGRARAHA
ncbi:MAG: flagellar biosynthesis protein FlhF [Steroidobacteraceae bacterium]